MLNYVPLDTGRMREGIAAYDLLRAIGNLSAATGPDGEAHVDRMVDLLIDGLRSAPASGSQKAESH